MPQMEFVYINYCSLAFSGLISTQPTFTTRSEILVIVKASQAVEVNMRGGNKPLRSGVPCLALNLTLLRLIKIIPSPILKAMIITFDL